MTPVVVIDGQVKCVGKAPKIKNSFRDLKIILALLVVFSLHFSYPEISCL